VAAPPIRISRREIGVIDLFISFFSFESPLKSSSDHCELLLLYLLYFIVLAPKLGDKDGGDAAEHMNSPLS
jgi:hypothetical protein